MAESYKPMIRVVKTGSTGEVASVSPEKFLKSDMDSISHITNQIVLNLQNNLQIEGEAKSADKLALTEVEMTFGIDIGVEAKSEIRFPIIGPLISGGAKAGATFEVNIKLARDHSSS